MESSWCGWFISTLPLKWHSSFFRYASKLSFPIVQPGIYKKTSSQIAVDGKHKNSVVDLMECNSKGQITKEDSQFYQFLSCDAVISGPYKSTAVFFMNEKCI
jgi:hypothetical protein